MTKDIKSDPQRKQPKPWVRLLLLTGLILILLPCLGMVGGVVHLTAWRAGVLSRWQRLKKLPASGVEIVTGNIDAVSVRAADGIVYRCTHGGRREQRKCWVEVQDPPKVERMTQSDSTIYEREVKPPAGTVVDTLETTARYAEDWFETRYVLLQDGTVWKWEHDGGMGRFFVSLFSGPLLGIALGVVAVVILWVVAGLQRLWRRHKKEAQTGVSERTGDLENGGHP